eukprot:TRINITY_DN20324_c0_g1_i1.p2 TRINITY_DN20324_c0_g1~~TRINITY_DN20324_c0_g1_i1.p2  ORF type:complete len:52 (-),score=1.24 TRINITY_DN20324_c0_g1_i1:201-356(-)
MMNLRFAYYRFFTIVMMVRGCDLLRPSFGTKERVRPNLHYIPSYTIIVTEQ